MVGYFEGIDSECGIVWCIGDLFSLWDFLGILVGKVLVDYLMFLWICWLIDMEMYQVIFNWVFGVLDEEGFIKGRMIGVDVIMLEVNVVMCLIVW